MTGPRITLLLDQYTEGVDEMGGITQTWAYTKTIKGVFTSSSGRETFSNNKKIVDSSHLFFCDYFSDVTLTEKNRFRYGARTFDITYVDNLSEQNIFFKIYLKEQV